MPPPEAAKEENPIEPNPEEPAVLWHEDSAIWQIIAGEMVVQHTDAITGDPAALMRRGREHTAEAADLLEAGDKNHAGHTLIGSALALALAARAQSADPSPIEHFASELAASISWHAAEPSAADVREVSALLEGTSNAVVPTLWELAVRVGSYAAGLSPYVTRRRQRRDLV